MATVTKSFPFYANGIEYEILEVGAIRDFGALTAGLVAAGLVAEEAKTSEAVVVAKDAPPVAEKAPAVRGKKS